MGRVVEVIGVPTDFGANRRGVDMGPSAIRYAGLADRLELAGVTCVDRGDIVVPPVDRWPVTAVDGLDEIDPTKLVCRRVRDRVSDAKAAGHLPIILGGDHSITIGSVGGVAESGDVGVIWLDAHADFNTPETSPSGNVHGMSLAALLHVGSFADDDWPGVEAIAPERVAIVGVRDVDPGEGELLAESDVAVHTMSDIDRTGIAGVSASVINRASDGVDALHVSLDLDFLDPLEAPGVGTPVRGGVTYREAHYILEHIAATVEDRSLALSIDLVEVNPIHDQANETAALATELAASAIGKRILPAPVD